MNNNRFDDLEHTIMLLVVRLKTKGFFDKDDVDDVLRIINKERAEDE